MIAPRNADGADDWCGVLDRCVNERHTPQLRNVLDAVLNTND